MIRVAIIDAMCHLSALPTLSDFEGHNFITKDCAVIACEVEEAVVHDAWLHRDIVYVLPANTPVPVDLPEGAYVLSMDLSVKPPTLKAV